MPRRSPGFNPADRKPAAKPTTKPGSSLPPHTQESRDSSPILEHQRRLRTVDPWILKVEFVNSRAKLDRGSPLAFPQRSPVKVCHLQNIVFRKGPYRHGQVECLASKLRLERIREFGFAGFSFGKTLSGRKTLIKNAPVTRHRVAETCGLFQCAKLSTLSGPGHRHAG